MDERCLTLPEVDGCLAARVPISAELRRYLAVAESAVVDVDPLVALLCYGHATRLAAGLSDDELPRRAARWGPRRHASSRRGPLSHACDGARGAIGYHAQDRSDPVGDGPRLLAMTA